MEPSFATRFSDEALNAPADLGVYIRFPLSFGSIKVLLTLLLILMFCLFVPAQQKVLMDELKAFKKFRSEKLRELTLYESNTADVKRVMGEPCQYSCDYDTNWDITFGYLVQQNMIKDGQSYRLKPEMPGKLGHITFSTKVPVKIPEDDELPEGWVCRITSRIHEGRTVNHRECVDDRMNISFYVAAETTGDGRFVFGPLVRIIFNPKWTDQKDIWELVPKQN